MEVPRVNGLEWNSQTFKIFDLMVPLFPMIKWKCCCAQTHSFSSRSENLKRCFSGREKLFSLGYPVWGPACAAGRVEQALANLISFYYWRQICSEPGLMCSHVLGWGPMELRIEWWCFVNLHRGFSPGQPATACICRQSARHFWFKC